MTESTANLSEAIRGKLASRKFSKKKNAEPGELLARAQSALEELQLVIDELAAAEPVEDGPADEEA